MHNINRKIKKFSKVYYVFLFGLALSGLIQVLSPNTVRADSSKQFYVTSSNSSNDILGGTTQNFYAQSILTDTTYDVVIDSVTIYNRRQGSPTDNIQLEIRADSSGSPSTTVIAYSEQKSYLQFDTTTSYWVNYAFMDKPVLTKNTTYWIVIKRTGSANNTNLFKLGYDSDTYSGGVLKYSANGTSSWTTSAIGNVDATMSVQYSRLDCPDLTASTNITITNCAISASGGGGTINNYYDPVATFQANIFRGAVLFLLVMFGLMFYFLIKWKKNG